VVWNEGPRVLRTKWGVLILAEFKGYVTPEMKATITGSSMNTDVVVIPWGWGTSQLQVLDDVVNTPLKDHLKQLCNVWLLTGDHALTPS
jgi:hypothetical protein